MPQGAKVQRVPVGADKNLIANGALAVHVHGGSAPGEGFAIFVSNEAAEGSAALDVSLDFGKSTNLTVLGNDEDVMDVIVSVKPGDIVRAADLEPVVPSRNYRLEWMANWRGAQVDPLAAAKEVNSRLAITSDRIATQLEIEAGLTSFAPNEVNNALQTKPGAAFVDTFFPPVARSVGTLDARVNTVWRRPCEFMPADAPINVFESDVQPSDISQGELGNCWFMCSLAALTEYPRLVDALFVDEWRRDGSRMNIDAALSSEVGLYTLRFCFHGQWITTTIDDHFPCRVEEGGGPVFSQASGNELWVLLIEKAYAKLQGSYFACRLGSPHEALIDLTGAPTYKHRFTDGALTFDDLLAWDINNCLICASSPGVDEMSEGHRPTGASTGLVPGHAYTVVQARIIQHGKYAGSRVLQIRNPWGSFEWGGAWSDQSPEMRACKKEIDSYSPFVEDELAPTTTRAGRGSVVVAGNFSGAADDTDDGIFWMSFEDFTVAFVSVSVCAVFALKPGTTLCRPADLSTHPTPVDDTPPGQRYIPPRDKAPEQNRKSQLLARSGSRTPSKPKSYNLASLAASLPRWDQARMKSWFTPYAEGLSAPDSRRVLPAHFMHVNIEGSVRVHCTFTLSQMDRRVSCAPGYADVGLVIYQLMPGEQLEERAIVKCQATRDVLLECFLDPGQYMLLPVTAGVRPLSGESPTNSPLKPEEGCQLSQLAQAALQQIFFMYDTDLNGHLQMNDLTAQHAAPFVRGTGIDLTAKSGEPLPQGKYICLADHHPAGLTCDALEKLLLRAWGPIDVRWTRLFQACGFDAQLRPTYARMPFVIALHSSSPVAVRRGEIRAPLYDATLATIVRKHGKQLSVGKAAVYSLPTAHGAIFAGENFGSSRCEVTLDCEASSNMVSSCAHSGLKMRAPLNPWAPGVAGNDPGLATASFLMGISQADYLQPFRWRYKCGLSSKRGAADAPLVIQAPRVIAERFHRLAEDVLKSPDIRIAEEKAALALQKICRGKIARTVDAKDGGGGVGGPEPMLVSSRAKQQATPRSDFDFAPVGQVDALLKHPSRGASARGGLAHAPEPSAKIVRPQDLRLSLMPYTQHAGLPEPDNSTSTRNGHTAADDSIAFKAMMPALAEREAEFAQREADMRKKQQALESKEAELQVREQTVRGGKGKKNVGGRENDDSCKCLVM